MLNQQHDMPAPQRSLTMRLRFKFQSEKLVNALRFFAAGGVTDLTKLKAVKLLYLADRAHLLEHGRPIIGDRYIAMDLGPVPESSYQLLGALIAPDEVSTDEAHDALIQSFAVDRDRRYPTLQSLQPPDMDVFSDSEEDALRQTLEEYGSKSASKLVDITHEHVAYKMADARRPNGSSVDLPYEYFFEDRDTPARELALKQQEDFEFADDLQRFGRIALAQKKADPH